VENIKLTVTKDQKLNIEIDLKKKGTLSKSGKSLVVASTLGNVQVPDTEFKLGLNCYTAK
jgi:hypothetical protein